MKKIVTTTLMATAITFSLFVFMQFLISSDKVNVTVLPNDIPVVVMSLPDERPPAAKPVMELKPPMVTPPIPSPVEAPTENVGPATFEFAPPVISTTGGFKGITLNKKTNNEATPLVRVAPKYPIKAAMDGIEGWVVLTFTINSMGGVVNISVLESEPKRIFDKAARQALKKWKYKAKKVDGTAVEQKNLSVQLDFNMSK
jgi:protein TonB